MHPNLSFEQAPPISVPYRFFLTAPWFGVAAGLLLVWLGADALASRWVPGALAATHLLTAGFMLQAMIGASFQFVPVAAGGNVWRPRLLVGVVHPALTIAVVLLVLAFMITGVGGGHLFLAAATIFSVVLGGYVVVACVALWRTPARGTTIPALRAAIFGLAVTVVLGVALAGGLGLQKVWPLIEMTNVHAAWGLGGWSLLLLAGVSYYVVPMFQLTPAYPAWLARWLPVAMLSVLGVWSFQLAGNVSAWQPQWQSWVLLVGLALAAAFAVATLTIQFRRRRKVPDPTLGFFRAAMLSLLMILASALVFEAVPELGSHPRAAVWLGMLALPGVFVSAINGMLYKIMPFLNWLHLQRFCGLTMLPPNMKRMIPESSMFGQMRLHFVALAVLLASVPWPELTRPAGALFAVSCAWLGGNLIVGVRSYLVFRDRIRAGGADRES
ncbi:MAG: hypothetical protein Q8O34_01740 [Rhodocyclaceae bacterium]|nr:hypothetical protein [Rhodocyclaceae bacterium]